MRYKFGPRLSGHFPRPDVPGELPDVEVQLIAKGHRAGPNPGEIDIDFAFVFPPHDPSQGNVIQEVHVIHFAHGHGIPTDPEIAIASSLPKTASTPPDMSAGGEHVVTLAAVPAGGADVISVLGYPDAPTSAPDPSDPSPADPSAAIPAATPPAPADPSVAADPTSTPAS